MWTYRVLLITIGIAISNLNADSQDIQYAAKEYIAEDGTIYWNKKLPVYLSISPYPNAKGTLLKSKDPSHSNPIYLDTEGPNYIRTRYAVDNQTQEVVSPLVEVLMPIVADGEGPKSSISYSGAKKWTTKQTTYYGRGLKASLTTSDRYSGVEVLFYNLDNGGNTNYSSEIAITSQGGHSIHFYGVDHVGNKEETKSSSFVVDLTPPSVTHNINGFADDNVIASTSKIYFTAADGLSGLDRVMYRFDEGEFRLYNGSNVNFSSLSDGEHTLQYYAIDKVGNQTSTFSYDLYFDKTAPLTASDILGDRFVVNDKVYFSGRTKMKLTAVDNKIGVKEIRYSINKEGFDVYDQPFYLPSIPGEHRIRYYSVDRLANRPSGSESYKHNISLVYLDLAGPLISHRLLGPSFKAAGVQYISPRTEIKLIGRDKAGESGLKRLTFSINGAAAETHYDKPFTIGVSGPQSIELFGYDNVNNRNIGGTEVFVDATPPNIFENFSTRSIGFEEGIPTYPPYVTVFLAATDDMVGNDKIFYSINGGNEKVYTRPIAGLRKGSTFSIVVRAVDMVGNESKRSFQFKTTAN